MKLVVNAYARSGAESADRTEKTAGKLRSAAAIVLVAGSGFFRSGVCGEVFDIPTVDAGGRGGCRLSSQPCFPPKPIRKLRY